MEAGKRGGELIIIIIVSRTYEFPLVSRQMWDGSLSDNYAPLQLITIGRGRGRGNRESRGGGGVEKARQ